VVPQILHPPYRPGYSGISSKITVPRVATPRFGGITGPTRGPFPHVGEAAKVQVVRGESRPFHRSGYSLVIAHLRLSQGFTCGPRLFVQGTGLCEQCCKRDFADMAEDGADKDKVSLPNCLFRCASPAVTPRFADRLFRPEVLCFCRRGWLLSSSGKRSGQRQRTAAMKPSMTMTYACIETVVFLFGLDQCCLRASASCILHKIRTRVDMSMRDRENHACDGALSE
jgi:hypothetical protein